MQLYVQPLRQAGQGVGEMVFGFVLDGRLAPTSGQLVAQGEPATQMSEALLAQQRLVARFWTSGIVAWDLRFVKTAQASEVAIGLLCRVSMQGGGRAAPDYQTLAWQVQTLFRECGYKVTPLLDGAALRFFLAPFEYRAMAEVRRNEDLCDLHSAHEVYEFYVTYPWQWSATTHQRLLTELAALPENCLVSVCLQPAQLSHQEQQLFQHATTGRVREMLLGAGAVGNDALTIYEGFQRRLTRPLLLQIRVAAASSAALEKAARACIEDLAPTSSRVEARPVIRYPMTPYEFQALQRGLTLLEWSPWGDLRAHEPQTARLRYLVDAEEASMAFRLPLAEERRVVILTALQVEFQAIAAYLSDAREETYKGTVYERGNFVGNKGRWEVAVAQVGAGASGVSTAVEADRAIAYFKPHVILLVGVASGLKDVAPGDVVVATKVYGYESGKFDSQGYHARPEVGNSSHVMVQRALAEARKSDWLRRIQYASTPPEVLVGPIAAGEKTLVSTRSELYQLLQTHFEDTLAIELEGLGFLQAAFRYPDVRVLIVRGIVELISARPLASHLVRVAQVQAVKRASAFAFEILAKLDM